jgi:hypothetical protein
MHSKPGTRSATSSRAAGRLRALAQRALREHARTDTRDGNERLLHALRRHHLLREIAGALPAIDPRREECAIAIDALACYESLCFEEARSTAARRLEVQLDQRLSQLARVPRR